ncbi:FxsA family protein [Streptomyces sp. CHA1]|uniref:FxsA family membrane protein n=1 Tax=unclassified Streptomyces TaxID=2593676 RepID=UPI001BFC7841|nr:MULTISPECIES: FxsA family membrane protein [unclassified Streptomyces]MBT3160015.1 FxsA family protein [Streptomyces sp. G11C]MCO6704007.1 FxsA family protein [Streptomyces sp. CHB9.2]MCO6710299.1 FxsA family protein [Streptomyces sp. CHA3]MCO6716074.1 FxsA family protein [Streptomyces sp. CHB19.2]MCO6722205.1 FxsA family protein [Streptomyces sp. Vc714c-19]
MTTGAPPPSRNAPRSRLRTLLPLALVVWLILEVWLLTRVAEATSGFIVFLLLLAGVVAGSALIKRAGRRALRKFQETVAQQQQGITPETDRSGGNAFLLIAGLLLILPGLVSDVLGLVLLLPPVRTALARRAERSLERRMAAAGPGTFGGAFQQARMRAPDGKVVQGEVVHDDEPTRPGGRDDDPRPPLTP